MKQKKQPVPINRDGLPTCRHALRHPARADGASGDRTEEVSIFPNGGNRRNPYFVLMEFS